MNQAPVEAPLALEPDRTRPGTVDLSGLDGVDFGRFEHASGPAGDIPDLLRRAASDTDDGGDVLDELLGDELLPHGTCRSATAPALCFVTRLAGPGLPARRRLDVALWLLYASDRWAAGLIGDAEEALAGGRPPRAAPWTQDVYRVVGAGLPALLAGWAEQPPAVRYSFAGLAALHPEPGAAVVGDVVALAAEYAGTVQGAYLEIAAALVTRDAERALVLADAVLSWDEDIAPEWVTAPGVDAAQRAGHVLAEGMQHTAR